MLLVLVPHFENLEFRQLPYFTIKEIEMEKLVDCPRYLRKSKS